MTWQTLSSSQRKREHVSELASDVPRGLDVQIAAVVGEEPQLVGDHGAQPGAAWDANGGYGLRVGQPRHKQINGQGDAELLEVAIEAELERTRAVEKRQISGLLLCRPPGLASAARAPWMLTYITSPALVDRRLSAAHVLPLR